MSGTDRECISCSRTVRNRERTKEKSKNNKLLQAWADWEAVITLMEVDKLFHEPEHTMQQLSNRLQMPTYLVSQPINSRLNKKFYELINEYRVEEAKK